MWTSPSIAHEYCIAGNFRWVLIFADCIRSRENENHNNLFQQKFKGRFLWNRENKNRKNHFTQFYLLIAKIFVRKNFPLYGILENLLLIRLARRKDFAVRPEVETDWGLELGEPKWRGESVTTVVVNSFLQETPGRWSEDTEGNLRGVSKIRGDLCLQFKTPPRNSP